MSKTTADTLKAKKYCIRCTYEMWYDETKRRWYCTNSDCVKYKPQPIPEGGEDNTGIE